MNNQNPFSIYDFLGYLIPGAFTLCISNWLYLVLNTASGYLNSFYEIISFLEAKPIYYYIPITILAYFIGHLSSFVSSITVEKYANWKNGYPSKYILGYKLESIWDLRFSTPSSKVTDILWRVFLVIFLSPIFLMDVLLGDNLNFKNFYVKSLNANSVKALKKKINEFHKSIGVEPDFFESSSNNNDYHRAISHYVYDKFSSHRNRMTNYVALYGFLRNLSFILSTITLIITTNYIIEIFRFIINYDNYNSDSIIIFKDYLFNIVNHHFVMIVILLLLSFLAYMAFMKFFRRYTLEAFMLLLIDKDIK